MLPLWLTVSAQISLILAGLCALIVTADVLAHPQKMPIINVV